MFSVDIEFLLLAFLGYSSVHNEISLVNSPKVKGNFSSFCCYNVFFSSVTKKQVQFLILLLQLLL